MANEKKRGDSQQNFLVKSHTRGTAVHTDQQFEGTTLKPYRKKPKHPKSDLIFTSDPK